MTFEQPNNSVDFYSKSPHEIEALPMSPASDENNMKVIDENFKSAPGNYKNILSDEKGKVEKSFSNEEKILSTNLSLKEQNVEDLENIEGDVILLAFKSNPRSKSAASRSVLREIPTQRRSRLSTTTSIGDVSVSSACSSRFCTALPSYRSRSMSRLSCNSLDKASIILAANAAHLPSRDRKILELMVSRHENKLQEQEMKQFVRKRWEEEKKINEQRVAEEEEARRRFLIKENEQYQFWRKKKQAALEEKFKEEIAEKEEAIVLKAEKWSRLAEEQEILRSELIERRKKESEEKKKTQEFHLGQMEKEREQLNTILNQLKEHSLLKAGQKRHLIKLRRQLEVQLENENSARRHMVCKAELDEKLKNELEELQLIAEAKDAHAKKKYEEIVQKRAEVTQIQMIEREEKFNRLRGIQKRLNREFREWQQQLVEYRDFVNLRATFKVHQQLSSRLEDLRKERVAKVMHHDRLMQSIQNEESKKLTTLKRKVQFKEIKSEIVARKKDQEINQSRAMAWASAELRDKLSKTLNPETFDQKVHRVEMENRVLRRRPLLEFYHD